MKKKISAVFTHMILIIISFICVFPFFWMVVGITNSSVDITQGKLTFGNYFMTNLQTVIEKVDLFQIIFNSVVIAFFGTVLSLIVASMAAYAFQIYHNKFRERIYNLMLVSLMIPFAALMIPLYKEVVFLGLLNTYTAVVLQLTSSVFLVFFFRQSLKNFPLELIESSRIDGASELLIFARIVVPSMKATYASATIYAFMGAWNGYLWPLLVIKSNDMKTFPLAISALSTTNRAPDVGAVMLLIVFSTIPMLVIFFVFQKQFVQGMVGSSK